MESLKGQLCMWAFFYIFAFLLEQQQKKFFFSKKYDSAKKSIYALPMLCQASRAGHFMLWHSSIRFQYTLASPLTPTCLQVTQFSKVENFLLATLAILDILQILYKVIHLISFCKPH